MQRFQQECAFLESIRHPNIVQYLGTTRDPESRLPVLLTELMDESLTKMLEESQRPLEFFVEINICHDIALAVTYLHSNDIIHRDLSSNNVLIIAKRRAKVTDFGMSKLSGTTPTKTSLTMCPGTVAYMPPEALEEPPSYTMKLDCFSEGVIMIQVCTKLWPKPGPSTKTVPFPSSPTGVTKVPVLEPERRKDHIDMIKRHPLLPIALNCLCYQQNERPSSEELCQRLATLKQDKKYRESVALDERRQNDMSNLESCKSKIRKLTEHLEEQEQVTAEIQQANHKLQEQVEQLQRKLSQQSLQKVLPLPPQKEHQRLHVPTKELHSQSAKEFMLTNWKVGQRVPINMYRGASVVKKGVPYFMNWPEGRIYSYNVSTRSWSEFPRCKCKNSSLAVIRGLLTAIGGLDQVTMRDENKLFSIMNKKWVEHFPPMPTKRCCTAAVTTKEHLIVVGGNSRLNRLNKVEVMNIETLVWSTAASLPHPYSGPSATICRTRLYVLGGLGKTDCTVSVLTCSLTNLLQSSSSSESVWSITSSIPGVTSNSTCVEVNGQLVAVGGNNPTMPSSAVHKYNPTTNSWQLISNMPTARSHCLIAVLPTDEIIVVGGNILCSSTNKVEIADITYHE